MKIITFCKVQMKMFQESLNIFKRLFFNFVNMLEKIAYCEEILKRLRNFITSLKLNDDCEGIKGIQNPEPHFWLTINLILNDLKLSAKFG